MKPNVLFVRGIPDDQNIKIVSFHQNRPNYRIDGISNLFQFIQDPRFETRLLYLDTQPTSDIQIKPNTQIIFSEISEPDRYKIVLKKVEHLAQELNLPCLNHPQKVLKTSRDQVYQVLKDLPGLIVPITLRVKSPLKPVDLLSTLENGGLKYPVILRECGYHQGRTSYLIHSSQEIHELYALSLDGRDYYLTQYHDYAQAGLYTKYRLIVIQGELYIRNIDTCDAWMVHYQKHFDYKQRYPEAQKIEIEKLEDFHQRLKSKIQPLIYEIAQIIGLEYFGIDCHINHRDEILIFEVNANMNVLLPDYNAQSQAVWEADRQRILQALHDLIYQRLQKQE